MLLTGKTQATLDAEKIEADRLAEISTLTAYLTSTDWYATRMAETGKAIPEEIVAARQKARDRISELKRGLEPVDALDQPGTR